MPARYLASISSAHVVFGVFGLDVAGGVTEVDVRVILRYLFDPFAVTEGGRVDYVVAFVAELAEGCFAFGAFRDVLDIGGFDAHFLESLSALVVRVPGEEIAYIQTSSEQVPVYATITGIIRGLIRDGYPVTQGFKIADIDPRQEELCNCFTISDKARCIAGSVLEVVCSALL